MPDFVLSPDGTGFLSVTPEAPAQPQTTDVNIQPTQPGALSPEQELNLRKQMGLDIPESLKGLEGQAQGTPAALTPGQKYTVQQLLEMGYVDPEGQHDLTKLSSYRTTVSSHQRQLAEAQRNLQALAQRDAQAQQQVRQLSVEQQRQQAIAQADPADRATLQQQFAEQDRLQRERELQQRIVEYEDAQELERWKVKWVNEQSVPPEIINVIDRVAAQNRISDPMQKFTFFSDSINKFWADVAAGRVAPPGRPNPTPQQPTQPQQPNPYQQQAPYQTPAQPQTQGTPYIPVVNPAGGTGQRVSSDALLWEAMNATGPDADKAWEKYTNSLFRQG